MSSLNLNKVVLCGRLTADPELKQTQNGVAVVTFTLAVNRRFQSRTADAAGGQQADFISLVAWRQTAEFISKYFKKGSALCVTGSIQTRSWQDQQGQERTITEIRAEVVRFLDSASGRRNLISEEKGDASPSENRCFSDGPLDIQASAMDDTPF